MVTNLMHKHDDIKNFPSFKKPVEDSKAVQIERSVLRRTDHHTTNGESLENPGGPSAAAADDAASGKRKYDERCQ